MTQIDLSGLEVAVGIGPQRQARLLFDSAESAHRFVRSVQAWMDDAGASTLAELKARPVEHRYEPLRAQIESLWEAIEEAVGFEATNTERFRKVWRAVMNLGRRYVDPGAKPEAVELVLRCVEGYGPWGCDLNEALRFQIVLADEVKRLRQQQQGDPWREAIENAMIVGFIEPIRPDETPDRALARLIAWEVNVALAPAAAALRDLLDAFHSGRVKIDEAATGWVTSLIEAGEAALAAQREKPE